VIAGHGVTAFLAAFEAAGMRFHRKVDKVGLGL
jgi:hypothetical protein